MIVFEFCEPDIRPTYIGFNNTYNGMVAIIMPLLGGWLAKSYGYQMMFTTSFIICLIGWAMLRFWVREPRVSNNPVVTQA
jgi:MFS family permease